jgi:hypothetical protein
MTATVNSGYPFEATTAFVGTASYTYSKLTVTQSTDANATVGENIDFYGFGHAAGLQYSEFGLWALNSSVLNTGSQYIGTYGGALSPAPVGSVPTSGTASYNGLAVGSVQNSPSSVTSPVAGFSGNVSLNANFSAGTIGGSITSIKAYNLNVLTGSVNDIVITAAITGANISGTTAATGAAGTGYDITGAVGNLVGVFAGPAANEVAGAFNLSGGPNSTRLIGAFGAKQAVVLSAIAASDIRLKADVARAGNLPNGLPLYRWHYVGGVHRFTGVMAQDVAADPRFANAVIIDEVGLMRVDYAAIGYAPADFALMQEEGEAAAAFYSSAVH